MYPGQVTRLTERVGVSAATIVADADVLILSGATGIENITKLAPIGDQILFIIPITGSLVLGVTGNIAVAQTLIVNKVSMLIYSNNTLKWYPHALA